jgi:DNA-binding transcriptional ArsR family regulator
MLAFDVLGDPVRRRILELIADGELAAGAVTEVVQREFGISQPAVSQHLRVLRESGFATVRVDGSRRLYAVDATPLQEIDLWLEQFRHFWNQRLDALATELKRMQRVRQQKQADEHRAVTETDGPGAGDLAQGNRRRRSGDTVGDGPVTPAAGRRPAARNKESA